MATPPLLVAEDLLLLLLDDERGTPPSGVPVDTVLGGAVLVELASGGHVAVAEQTSRWRAAKVRATGTTPPPSDPVLAEALTTVAAKEREASDLVDRLGKGLRSRLADRLVDRGVLEREDEKVLGLFSRTRWPAADREHEAAVRERLQAVLVDGAEPDERTVAIAALLHAVSRAEKTVDRGDVPAREVRRRAKDLAEGTWGAEAVGDAIAAVTLATTTAVLAASTAAVAAGGSS
ncbi:hypothetical protein GCM10023340_38220 [Nocardioides marinquilinus]|uniref:GPP34 family phosphoprotein n=1 Tax=Nocardioides marinquilinus TaxID=1210400 RepID=A0ABP9PZN1_9ACTN